MAGHNRHLKGDMNTILAPVRGKTVIEPSDFIYMHTGDSNYVYPFASSTAMSTTGACLVDIATNFLGVAMTGSISGNTESITVATAGVFRYPLGHASAVTIGSIVSAVSPHASSSGVSNQAVESNDDKTNGTTCYLGRIVKTNTSATSFVDFTLMTLLSAGTYNWYANINV